MNAQTFMETLLRKLASLGIHVPLDHQGRPVPLPPIHHHHSGQPIGEELGRAVDSATKHFGQRPNRRGSL